MAKPPKNETTLDALKGTVDDLRLSLHRRDELDRRIAKLRQGFMRLSAVSEDSGEATQKEVFEKIEEGRQLIQLSNKALGFTDACREALRGYSGWQTPRDVRNRLLEMEVDLSGKSNPLASIHTTLKRLVKAGEVASLPSSTGTVYMWRQIKER